MATVDLPNIAHMHFTGSGENTVNFPRMIQELRINTFGAVNLSLDGGRNFMMLPEGCYDFDNIHQKTIVLEGGAYSFVGQAR